MSIINRTAQTERIQRTDLDKDFSGTVNEFICS